MNCHLASLLHFVIVAHLRIGYVSILLLVDVVSYIPRVPMVICWQFPGVVNDRIHRARGRAVR